MSSCPNIVPHMADQPGESENHSHGAMQYGGGGSAG